MRAAIFLTFVRAVKTRFSISTSRARQANAPAQVGHFLAQVHGYLVHAQDEPIP
jgi:hypothetical protein